ncbi:PD40 domain-containing protein [Tamlana fucoidanivorans]|uniref:Tricorn protease homolog n=1 Tax=Allotamlana fucoidanivorans TaxID=2583814 RepID=A0A5C4SHF8_9FLAO|nr:S41 family peptidase [Tamlana fucoidanivorans]TNJ42963.1 PDZ domain-containing protein [Tamlana fucoidanivorans]
MKLNIIFVAVFSLFVSLSVAQTPLINAPAISPDGQHIAFNYQGDIWTALIDGSNTRRLTIHEAYDTNPIWSYDGKQIAFQSDRYGNDDIYTIPAKGGLPKRLTFHSAPDNITDYTKNGDILFSTRRNFAQVEREAEIHIVNEKGGTPYRFLNAVGLQATMSPNGKIIAFVRGTCRMEREAYQGPANRDIWVYHIQNDTYSKITTYNGNDFYPQWANDHTIYFQSSRSGKYNVHKVEVDDNGTKKGTVSQISNFTNMGIFSFQISRNGNDIIMVKGNKVYTYNVSSKKQNKINIDITSDYRFNPVSHKSFSSGVQDIAVSPNGKLAALEVRGELFIRETDKDKKRTVNVSKSAYRDRNAVWLNDSTLLFVSDRGGQNDIYLVKSNDKNQSNLFKTLKHKIERVTKTTESESSLKLAPNGKQMAFVRGRGKLIVADISDSGKLTNEKVLLNGWDTPSGISWSPDSKWLAYNLSDLDFNGEIYIHRADNTQKPVNISMHPKQDRSPVWSPDGRKLMFSSNRNNSDYDVWFTWLRQEDWEKTTQDWEENDEEKPKPKIKKEASKKEKKNTEKEDKDEDVDVIIDFEDIHERQVQVTSFVGGEFGQLFSKDSETIYYTTGNGGRGDAKVPSDLYKIKWNGKSKKEITSNDSKPSNLVVNSDFSKIYLTKGKGSLSSVSFSNDKSENLSFTARMNIDYHAESKQIFEEAWTAIRDGFYDPNFHGQNWTKLREIYEPLALGASTRSDFQNMFNWMLGQINASHMGLYGTETREQLEREYTGFLGLEVEPTKTGSLKVIAVVPNMPGDRSSSKVLLGDEILGVNGSQLTKDLNVYSLLEGTANQRIYLEVKRAGETLDIVIRPKSSNRNENYKAWVKERQRLTEKYSNGQLGYIHIQGMNWTSFERFERELTAAGLGKKGIVIDVRFNGGGWTTDYLMAVLNVKQHAYTVPRGAAKYLEKEHTKFKEHYPFSERLPLAAWTKPSIALCNQNSYSNAEIFSHAYKSLNLGTLVGVPTFGAVISTGGVTLIDGSYVRMPFRGWYVKDSGMNMELGPAQPDILVDNNPDDKANGEDSQLKKAVETLLSEIK